MSSTSSANAFHAASQNRMLGICVAASIVVHASLLFLVPGMRAQAPESSGITVITATLSSRVAAPPPAVAEAPRPPEPERPKPLVKPPPEPPRPLLTRPDTAAAPTAPRVAEPPPAPPAPAATPAPSAVQTAPANVVRAPEVQAPPVPATPSPAPPRPAEVADSGTLDQYRVALLGAANRYKRYPAIAMEKGWAGKVEVRIVIGTNGMTQSISVKTSSGFDVLDKTAVDMVTKAKPMTTIPPALRGREFAVDIPVIFSLQTG